MEPIQTRSKVLVTLFVLMIVCCAAMVFHQWSLQQFLYGIQEGGSVDLDLASDLDQRDGLLSLAYFVLYFALVASFWTWFHRAYKNLHNAELPGVAFKPGWAIGSFCVPLMNMVRPVEMMQETWRGSRFLAGDSGDAAWKSLPSSRLVGFWWAFFLCMNIAGQLAVRMEERAEELDAMVNASWAMTGSFGIDICTALLAIFVVKRVTALQVQAMFGEQEELAF